MPVRPYEVSQTDFTGGELAPTIFGRTDLTTYFRGMDKGRNVYVDGKGGAYRREGTEYIAGVYDNLPGRLISFSFNTEQTYLLEFTAGRMRVYRDDVYQTQLTSSPIDGLTADIVQEMDFTQSNDVLILAHPDIQPIEISRTGHASWTAANITLQNIPVFPFSGVTVTNPAATLTPSKTSGNVTLTASANVFSASTEKQYIVVNDGLVFVESYDTGSSGTIVTGYVVSELSGTGVAASGDWDLESGYEDVWSATRGWPASLTFFAGRLWFGGSKSRPQTIWASVIGDFFNFRLGPQDDDDAIDYTIDADQVNAIKFLEPGRNLQIFTTGDEFFVRSSTSQAITPRNFPDLISSSTTHGTKSVKPVSVNGATLFLEGSDDDGAYTVREFVYNDVELSYNAPDISQRSSHLINNPVAMAVRGGTQDIPTQFVYFVNSDGTVAVLNTLRQEELLAWTLFETDGEFEDVAVVDRQVYFIVKRTINSGTVRYIEKLNRDHKLDASLIQTSGSPTTSWSGLSHLEAETVRLFGDDFNLASKTVSSGAITTDDAVSELEAGLFFAARVKLMPVDAMVQDQTMSGKWRRLVYVRLRLYNSRNVVVKTNSKTYRPAFRQFGSNVLDAAIQLFTGWKRVYISDVDRDAQVEITQEDPFEFYLLAVIVGIR